MGASNNPLFLRERARSRDIFYSPHLNLLAQGEGDFEFLQGLICLEIR